ncbi:MAG: TonB family protein [Nitrospina sp.]|nr:TonB family protein [Nitrospina sp.]
MRVEFLPSIDFNQMLVYSTFAHLLFLTWIIFFPNYGTQEQIIVPTFRLDLIELSPKAKSLSLPINREVVPQAATKKKVVTKTKQLPPPKPLLKESKVRKKIIEDLKSLEDISSKQSLLQQLNLLARLPKAQESKVISPKVMQEETFREQDRAQTAELPLKSEPERSFPLVDDTQTKSERLVKLNIKEEEQPKSDLMKELEAIENKEIHPTDITIKESQFEKSNSLSAFKSIKGKSFTSVVEKLQELEESSGEIKINVSQGQVTLEKFKTSIQRAEVPVPEMENEPEGSSALSQYVGEVYKRVYSKWKTPLGSKFKDVTVSFTIFSKGNINTPVVRKSARDKNLDSIAVSAIIDAAPFPELPEKLKRSNLKINIIFKYVPEKK